MISQTLLPGLAVLLYAVRLHEAGRQVVADSLTLRAARSSGGGQEYGADRARGPNQLIARRIAWLRSALTLTEFIVSYRCLPLRVSELWRQW